VIVDILSLFPGYFKGPFDESILKRAQEKGLLTIRLTDIRDFADNRFHRVDDRPYGGGPGMVMMPQPVTMAIQHVKTPEAKVIYLSPQGRTLNAVKCRQLALEKHLILLCGHYEGIDQRVLDEEVDEEISIGDYVLTNGCLAAIVLLDAFSRFIPDVLGHPSAAAEDSFEGGLLDCPHYTRPEVFQGCSVPNVLLSGNHQEIAKWRHEQALKKTQEIRPDLLA
jgi:tRNA (guanine37-N1)-methyltransferase